VAKGSSVPVCPPFAASTVRLARCKAWLLDKPTGLSSNRTPSSARPRRLAIVESEKKSSDDSRSALVFRFVGLVRNRARTIGPVDERRHFDAACDLCVMYKTQGGHRVDMQQLIELRMQPACLLVEQRGGCVGLGAQHREI